MKLITICEIDSTGLVRAISEGRVTAEQIRLTHPNAAHWRRQRERRRRLSCGLIDLAEAPLIMRTARQKGWVR